MPGMSDLPTQLMINGELRDAQSGRTFATFDPAHGGELAQVAQGGADDVDAAVAAARGALEGAWMKTSPAKRARALNRLAQLLDLDHVLTSGKGQKEHPNKKIAFHPLRI